MSLPIRCKYGVWVLLAQKNGCGGLRGLPQFFFAVRPRVGDAAGAEASRSVRSMGGKDRHFFEKIGVMPEKRKDRDK